MVCNPISKNIQGIPSIRNFVGVRMAKKVLKADLSISGLRKLQSDLEKYKDNIMYKCQLLAERLAERGVEIARVRVAELDAIFTGELIESIHEEYKGSIPGGAIFAVVADSSHSLFVEFGSGQRGADHPYPYPLPDGISWDYNVGKTIRQSASGRYYWFYPGKDGKWHYTEGMPARPFMYETAMQLYQEVTDVAKEVFGK